MRIKSRLFALFILGLILSSFTVGTISSTSAHAAGPDFIQNEKVYKGVSAWQHWWWIRGCISTHSFGKELRYVEGDNRQYKDAKPLSTSQVDGWDFFGRGVEWFDGNGVLSESKLTVDDLSPLGGMYGTGFIINGDSEKLNSSHGYGYRSCGSQPGVVESAFKYQGLNNSRAVFCKFNGQVINGNKDISVDACKKGNDAKDWSNYARTETLLEQYDRDFAKPQWPGDPGHYLRSYLSLVKSCDITFPSNKLYNKASDVPSASDYYTIGVVVKNNKKYNVKYIQGKGVDGSRKVALVATTSSRNQYKFVHVRDGGRADHTVYVNLAAAQTPTCKDLARNTVTYAGKYKNVLERDSDNKTTTPQEDNDTDGGTGNSGNDPSATSCNIDGISWLICPVMDFLAKANEQAFGFIESMLGVRPEVVQDDATVEAWERFRDIANVAFVIAFMVIIYSQITSMGISNYGLKKLLPKIAVAAILVNLSLFICQILVDFSNIAGHSLYSFITNISPVPPGAENDGTWTSLMSGVLAGGAIVLLVVMLFLAPTVLLAVGMILLILVARQAFILILIIISPLAFVAYLLPNTEDLFKKWWKMLSAMLLVYPIIAVVFGASVLASNILMRIASQDGNIASAGNDDNQLLAMVALGVMAIPLFAVPGLLKGAMNGAGTIGAKLQGAADKMQGRSTSKATARAGEHLKRHAESVESKMATRGGVIGAAGRYRRRRDLKRGTMEAATAKRGEAALSDHILANPSGYSVQEQARAVQTTDKAWEENTKMYQGLYSHNSASDEQLLKDMEDPERKLSAEQRSAAAGMLMQRGRATQNKAVRKAVEMAQNGDGAIGGIQKQMAHDMGSRKPMGLGSGATAELRRGMLGVDGDGKPAGTGSSYDFDEEIAKRAVTKLAPSDIPNLDPDDIDEIKSLVGSKITGTELENLRASIKSAYADERINPNIDRNARGKLDEILNHGRGSNTPQTHEQALVENALYDMDNRGPSTDGS